MKACLILYLSIHFFQLPNLEWLDAWRKQEIAIGVADRVEGEKTVILMEERGEELLLDTEKVTLLAQEDHWFLISLKKEEAILLKALPTVTSEQSKRSSELVKQLRERE